MGGDCRWWRFQKMLVVVPPQITHFHETQALFETQVQILNQCGKTVTHIAKLPHGSGRLFWGFQTQNVNAYLISIAHMVFHFQHLPKHAQYQIIMIFIYFHTIKYQQNYDLIHCFVFLTCTISFSNLNIVSVFQETFAYLSVICHEFEIICKPHQITYSVRL